ncbi:LysR family transcriptional regulator [soil metagenome]
MLLTLRQIEIFRAVMRAGTLVGAARELGIAQPTVTKSVRRIEDICAFALFDRQGGRLTPTAEAHRLLGEVDLAFDQLEAAMARALRLARADTGSFRFGGSPSVGRVLIPRAAARLLARHPGVSLHLDILSVSQVMDYLLSGQGESAVTLFPILHAGIRSVCVGGAPAVAICPRQWDLAAQPAIAPAELAGRPLVVFEPQSVHGRIVDAVLREGGVTPGPTHVARFAESAIGLAEAGLGLAIVDGFSALAADRTRVAILPLDHTASYSVYLHRPVERAQGVLTRQFEIALRAEITEMTPWPIA